MGQNTSAKIKLTTLVFHNFLSIDITLSYIYKAGHHEVVHLKRRKDRSSLQQFSICFGKLCGHLNPPFYRIPSCFLCTNAEDQCFFSSITKLFLTYFLFFFVKSFLLVDSNNRGEEPGVPWHQVCEDKLKPKYICNTATQR
jgi:hypothetical protein